MLERMLTDLSKSQDSFELKLKRDNQLIKEADKLTLNDFQFISPTSANRVFNGQVTCVVYIEPRYCSCVYYCEFGVCKHFIALCKLTNRDLEEPYREFVHVKKRGRPAKSNNGPLNKN